MDVIHFSDMIRQLGHVDNQGNQQPFSVSFYAESGELITLDGCRVTVGKRGGKVIVDQRPRDPGKVRREPNHFANHSRNLLLQNGEIRKCHIRLITMFNGKKVVP